MNIRLIFFLILSLFSCRVTEKSNVTLVNYRDWKSFVSKIFEAELVIVCKNWPKEWDECPDGVLDWEAIDSINIRNDITLIDGLKKSFGIKENKPCKVALIHEFDEGFNSWYIETFLIKSGTKWKGKKLSRSAPPGSLADLMDEKPIEKAVDFSEDEIDYYRKLKSGTFAHNGGIKIITFLNEKNEITGCHMVLYP